jgi:predicted permease
MFSTALVILPEFAVMMLGLLLAQRFGFERGFWAGAEKLVYYVLFPPLLFNAIVAADFSVAAELRLLGAAVGAFLLAAAAGFLAWPLLRPPADVFASSVQTAFRYNSYIGLAFAQSLFGVRGVALMALIVAFVVPLANVIAVSALARYKRAALLKELVGNPLILATLSGLAANLGGMRLHPTLANVLGKLGTASLALGLLCIGAGLTLAAVREHRALMAYLSAVKLLAFPALAWTLAVWLGLTGLHAQVVLLFAALPTASSAYVLAARMGGKPAPVAVIVTVQTCLSMITLPAWLALVA